MKRLAGLAQAEGERNGPPCVARPRRQKSGEASGDDAEYRTERTIFSHNTPGAL